MHIVARGALALSCIFSIHTFAADEDGTKSLDLRQPPKHLEHSALLEFLRARGLTTFPQTFESLVRQFAYADGSPVTAYVPAGRSAQKDQTDLDQPRRLLTSHGANKVASRVPIGFEDYTALPGPDWEGRLYFGHAEKPAQAEVFSWNRDRRGFDKFVITQFDGKSTPVIAEVTDGSKCTQCHQNDAPIFTLPPWSEAMAHNPKRLFRDAVAATLPPNIRLFREGGVLVSAEQTPTDNNIGLAMDSASSVGNRLVQAARVLRDACGNDDDCRRDILVAALSNLTQSAYLRKNFVTDKSPFAVDFVNGPAARLKQQAQTLPQALMPLQKKLKRRWPATSFAYTSQLLTDPTAGLQSDTAINSLDPRTPRAALLPIDADSAAAYVADVAFETLGFTLADARYLQTFAPTDLVNRFTPGAPGYDEKVVKALLASWPPTREAILSYVTTGASNNGNAEAALSAPGEVPPMFHKYCASCHGKDSENGYLPLESAEVLNGAERASKDKIAGRLLRSEMPPRKAQLQPTALERQQMLAYLAPQDANHARPLPPVLKSHLGVRYLQVPGIAGSYIGREDSTIADEGVVEQCGSMPGLRAAKFGGDKGRVVLSLDNFPHYALGNIVQGPVPMVLEGRCVIVAVTRNGSLVRLAWDDEERGWYSRMLVSTAPPTTLVQLAVVNRDRNLRMELVGVGANGKLYRLDLDRVSFTWNEIAVTGIGVGQGWSRVAFAPRADSSQQRIYLERFDGRLLAMNYYSNTAMFEKVVTKAEIGGAFLPSLLRGDGVLFNPYGPESEKKKTTPLTMPELAAVMTPAEVPAVKPDPKPSFPPPPKVNPNDPMTGLACDRKNSTRECRGKAVGDACTQETASGAAKAGLCRSGAAANACSCY